MYIVYTQLYIYIRINYNYQLDKYNLQNLEVQKNANLKNGFDLKLLNYVTATAVIQFSS